MPLRASDGEMTTSGEPEPAASAASAASSRRSSDVDGRAAAGRRAGSARAARRPSTAACRPSASPSLRPSPGCRRYPRVLVRTRRSRRRSGLTTWTARRAASRASTQQRAAQHAQHQLLALLGVDRPPQPRLAARQAAQRTTTWSGAKAPLRPLRLAGWRRSCRASPGSRTGPGRPRPAPVAPASSRITVGVDVRPSSRPPRSPTTRVSVRVVDHEGVDQSGVARRVVAAHTACALASPPSDTSIASAGPRSAAPPTMGLTATTGAAAAAARPGCRARPGSCRCSRTGWTARTRSAPQPRWPPAPPRSAGGLDAAHSGPRGPRRAWSRCTK